MNKISIICEPRASDLTSIKVPKNFQNCISSQSFVLSDFSGTLIKMNFNIYFFVAAIFLFFVQSLSAAPSRADEERPLTKAEKEKILNTLGEAAFGDWAKGKEDVLNQLREKEKQEAKNHLIVKTEDWKDGQ